MDDEGGGPRLSKRFSDKGGGEVDYKTTAGTAWSHSYLNQKPWHPLSYPNQRRKWIAEQTHAQRQRRSQEIAREYAQEQDFLRQTSLLSQKEKEKVDMMQAVSFMYVRPPGYNAESAKAAEIADGRKSSGESDPTGPSSSSVQQEAAPLKAEKKKSRPVDVFGRTLPTEEEFAVLRNAPRLETGVVGRAKPFAVEVRNVKCVRCGIYGHQSGDRECPLKDAIMPNEESRLKRDDPLAAIMAQMDPSEPLKWELKQKPGISPPRGGFQPDDPNQQIVAEEIFDEYGGFLSGGIIPDLLTNFTSSKHKKKSKGKSNRKSDSLKKRHDESSSTLDSDIDKRSFKIKSTTRRKRKLASHKRSHELNGSPSGGESDGRIRKVMGRHKHKKREAYQDSDKDSDSFDIYEHRRRRSKKYARDKKRNKRDVSHSSMSENSIDEKYHGKSKHKDSHRRGRKMRDSHEDGYSGDEKKYSRKGETYKSKKTCRNDSEHSTSEDSEAEKYTRKYKRSYS